MAELPPFPFIVGCIRSGTTLLRLMLDRHPQMAIPPESYFPARLLERRARYEHDGRVDLSRVADDLLGDAAFVHFRRNWALDPALVRERLRGGVPGDIAEALRRIYGMWAEREGKPRYGDKTPVFVLRIAQLASLLPEARFVHLVRDGRDVAASILELGHPDHPRTLARVAEMWSRCVLAGRAAGAALGPGRYLEVRYEGLVARPESVLEEVCRFVDLQPHPEMLGTNGSRRSRVPAHERWQHRRLDLPPTPGLRNWRRDLPPAAVATFEAIAGDALTAAGYERAFRQLPLRPRLAAAGARAGSAARSGRSRVARAVRATARRVRGVTP